MILLGHYICFFQRRMKEHDTQRRIDGKVLAGLGDQQAPRWTFRMINQNVAHFASYIAL
jgi:hypothetical protein